MAETPLTCPHGVASPSVCGLCNTPIGVFHLGGVSYETFLAVGNGHDSPSASPAVEEPTPPAPSIAWYEKTITDWWAKLLAADNRSDILGIVHVLRNAERMLGRLQQDAAARPSSEEACKDSERLAKLSALVKEMLSLRNTEHCYVTHAELVSARRRLDVVMSQLAECVL